MEMTGAAAAPARRGFGLPALGGAAYAVLFVVGFGIGFADTPGGDDPPAKVIAYFADSGHRDNIDLGWILVLIGVFCLIWFLAALRRLLLGIDAGGQLTWVASIGGTIYAATTLVGISLEAAIYTMSDDTYHHQVYPSLIHFANDAGYVIHAAGGVGIGALMIATSLAVARAGLMARWIAIVGVVLGVLALASIFFFPLFGILIWLIVASIALFRTSAVVTPRGAPAV
ncbi:MAG: hypothetical protein ACJ76Z_03040 [Thermoleophilaceae bacterium]